MYRLWIIAATVAGISCTQVYDSDKYKGSDELAAPTVDAVQSPTNENPITVTGSGQPGAFVEVRGGAESVVSASVDDDGAFSIEVPLRADVQNMLSVSQVRGRAESPAVALDLVHDGTAPDTPVLDPVVTPTRRDMATLQGSAEPGSEVVASGSAADSTATADDAGRFLVVVELDVETASVTQHDLSIVARDAAGNASGPATATIVHNPALPIEAPVLDPLPGFSTAVDVTVSGLVEPELTVRIFGGTSDVTTVADDAGLFSTTVSLEANTSSTLSVFATVPAIGLSSPPATAIIAHDDIAPDAPNVDPVASPTGGATARIAGTSEPFAAISVGGGAATTSVDADDNGAFSVDVTLTQDAVNSITVTAADRAGNASDAAAFDVEQDSSLEEPVVVDPLASPTSSIQIDVTGTTQSDVQVEVLGGAATSTVTSGGDGTFSAPVTLNANSRNDLVIRRVGSTAETFAVVFHDDVAPSAPGVNTIPSPTNQSSITVSGSAEPSANVSISGGESPASGTADANGQFSIPVTIAEDATTNLVVIATDPAGNSSNPSSASVTHSSTVPDAPVVDDTSPPPTNAATHMVTGHVTSPAPGITIHITGGAADASGPTDEATGAFAVEVTLNANDTNTLDVFSREGTIDSPSSIVTVTHDDVAPDSPDTSKISLGNGPGLCIARVNISVTGGTGAAEPLSVVRVHNLTAPNQNATQTASADGSFSTSIRVCAGDVLQFTSTDAAQNVSSPPTEMTVP